MVWQNQVPWSFQFTGSFTQRVIWNSQVRNHNMEEWVMLVICVMAVSVKISFNCRKFKHEGLRYECNQCDDSFSSHGYLNIHKPSKHEGLKYNCNQCTMIRIHWRKKQYVCIQCDFQFEDTLLSKHSQENQT